MVQLCVLFALTVASVAWSQTNADFSGLWKQDNERCQPKRADDMTLRIELHGEELTVETTFRGSERTRHAVQKYTTDGKVSVSTGADGDEFHTAVISKNGSLVFAIEEHEDGRILRSSETWSLIEGGATLQRIRERSDGEKRILILRRQE